MTSNTKKTDDPKTDDLKTDDLKTNDLKTDDLKTDDLKTNDLKTDDLKIKEIIFLNKRTMELEIERDKINNDIKKIKNKIEDIQLKTSTVTVSYKYKLFIFRYINDILFDDEKALFKSNWKIKSHNDCFFNYVGIITNNSKEYYFTLNNYNKSYDPIIIFDQNNNKIITVSHSKNDYKTDEMKIKWNFTLFSFDEIMDIIDQLIRLRSEYYP